MKCPLCGAPANWRELVRPPWEQAAPRMGWERREYTMFSAGVVSQAVKDGASYEKRRPVRPANVQSDVAVPVLQSAISGFVTGVLGGACAGLAGLPQPLLIGLGTGAAGLGLAWLVILREHRAALWEVERIVGRDLDGDGSVGAPPRQPVRVEVTEHEESGRLKRMLFLDLPCTDEQLTALARGLTRGTSFAQTSWTGRGNPFSRNQFDRVRDALVERGLAYWVNPAARAQGVELTAQGRSVMRRIVEEADGAHARARAPRLPRTRASTRRGGGGR